MPDNDIIPMPTLPIPQDRSVSDRTRISRTGDRILSNERFVPSRPGVTDLGEVSRRALEYTQSRGLRGFIGSPSTNIQANDSTGNRLLPIYGSGSPFDILGDAFLRAFGGGVYNPPRESERTIIESAGGGTGGIGIIVILGVIGVAIYYFYLRK